MFKSTLALLLTITPQMALACEKACVSCCPSETIGSKLFSYAVMIGFFLSVWALAKWWYSEPSGVALDPVDPEYLAAKAEARRTLPHFFEAFDNPADDEEFFAVKFNLTPEKDPEFIWASCLRREGNNLVGLLDNEPLEPGYRPDTFVTINPNLIVDWTYTKAGIVQGHFVTKAMFKHMPKRSVRRAEREFGWR